MVLIYHRPSRWLTCLASISLLTSINAATRGITQLPARTDNQYLARAEVLITCLQRALPFTTLQKIQIRKGALRRIETCAKHVQPVLVQGHRAAFLNQDKLFALDDGSDARVSVSREQRQLGRGANSPSFFHHVMSELLSTGYGNESVRWQFASNGERGLPHLASTQEKGNFLTFAEAMSTMNQRRRNLLHIREVPVADVLQPSFFSSLSNTGDAADAAAPGPPPFCQSELNNVVAALQLDRYTPLYAVSSTTGMMSIKETRTLESILKSDAAAGQKRQNSAPSPPGHRYGNSNQNNDDDNINNNNNNNNNGKRGYKRRADRSKRRSTSKSKPIRLSRTPKPNPRKPRARQRKSDSLGQTYKNILRKKRRTYEKKIRAQEEQWTTVPQLRRESKSGFVERMLRDSYFPNMPPKTIAMALTVHGDMPTPHGIDVYIGMPMSGTHGHYHGTAMQSSTGRKLWMLYGPQAMCDLDTAEGIAALQRAGLPPLCDESSATNPGDSLPRTNKFHEDSDLCLGQLHPLEVLYRIGHLDTKYRPMLVLTEPGDIIVLPERWLHLTLNLDDSLGIAYRYELVEHLNCDVPLRLPTVEL